MLQRSVEFYCDCCGTRIDDVTFFNVILGVVYHYHAYCFEQEITPTLTKEILHVQ